MIDTPLLVTIGLALGLAGVLQGRRLVELRWEPDRHTVAAIAAGLLPALLSAFCLLLSQDSLAYQAILFLGIYASSQAPAESRITVTSRSVGRKERLRRTEDV